MKISTVLFSLRRKRLATILVAGVCFVCLHVHHMPTETVKHVVVLPSSEDLTVYKLPESFSEEPIHLTPIDPTMLIELGNDTIDAAHRKGILHTGGILYIMDASDKILVMKRSRSVVTCPDTWSILGEHSIVGEDANDLPARALAEELGLSVTSLDITIQNLTAFPLYYIRYYGARNGNRIDRQLTHIWFVKLPKRHQEIDLRLDHEVAGHKWVSVDEMDKWLERDARHDVTIKSDNLGDDGPPNGDFCHHTIRSLLQLGVKHLKIMLETIT